MNNRFATNTHPRGQKPTKFPIPSIKTLLSIAKYVSVDIFDTASISINFKFISR